MLTASRSEPTIGDTLRSLWRAGFDDVHLFAEPGAAVPDEFSHLPVSRRGRKLGTLGNTYSALAELYMLRPDAGYYAIFQDDLEVAEGLKAWCEGEPWPADAGLISLFTPRVLAGETTGWRLLRMGFHRTFGAQAFVFRRDALLRFMTDSRVLAMRHDFSNSIDGVVGEWSTRTGLGIAYHTPSLVQHVGYRSSIEGHDLGRHGVAEAVDSVERINGWVASPKGLGKIGLVGWNTASGLGYLNRDLAIHGGIDRWLVPERPYFPTLSPPACAGCRIDRVPPQLSDDEIRAWMAGLDWVLFVEIPYIYRLAQQARGLGISVAHVPNWELSDPRVDWMNYVDLVICSTAHTHRVFSDWRVAYGHTWDMAIVPWPIDVQRFRFRERRRCERFVFINGTGGCRASRPDGSKTPYRRKGLELLFEAARLVPELSFLVYSQVDIDLPIPRNVEVRAAPEDNERLYDEGDVCVQPSHWEGLGLTLLECQAAGMPLITTDAPPMNELRPFRVVPTSGMDYVSLFELHPFPSCLVKPEDLASVLREVAGTDLSEASHAARAYVESDRSWEREGPVLRSLLTH
jgi:glycosyltransferase involved in cell wall biosynthesis